MYVDGTPGETYTGGRFYFKTSDGTADHTERMTILGNGNLGIGTPSPSSLLHLIKTTEQFRSGYNTSNYWNATTSSTGITTFDAVGSGASFVFSDTVKASGFISSDGTAGATATTGGATFKNGLYVSGSISGGGATQVFNEVPTGSINSSNTVFTTAGDFETGTTRVYLNGIRQKLSTDYTETDTDEITFTVAPTTGDELIIDYQE
jgi:hypothetical protein